MIFVSPAAISIWSRENERMVCCFTQYYNIRIEILRRILPDKFHKNSSETNYCHFFTESFYVELKNEFPLCITSKDHPRHSSLNVCFVILILQSRFLSINSPQSVALWCLVSILKRSARTSLKKAEFGNAIVQAF